MEFEQAGIEKFCKKLLIFSQCDQIKNQSFKIDLKENIVEDEIPERGLWNPQISGVGSWKQIRPTQLPLLLYTRYLSCKYI